MRVGIAFVRLLPRSSCLFLARIIGQAVFAFLFRYRAKTVDHLKSVFGGTKTQGELERIARNVFVNLALNAVDWCKWSQLSTGTKKQLITADPKDIETLRSLLREGWGLIGLGAHLGNWEILGAFLTENITSMSVVGRRIYYEPFNRTIVNLRKSWGVKTIYADGSPREILKILKQGGFIGMLIDQDVEGLDGVFVPFFGKLAFTPTAPFRMSLSTGSPLFVTFLIREGDRYRFVVKDMIRIAEGVSRRESIQSYTRLVTNVFESMVRLYPDQWVWMHNRWKTRPEDGMAELNSEWPPREAQIA